MTWKKIGVRGKPVYVAEWPTFIIEIHSSGDHLTPFVKTRDGAHGYGLGLYNSLEAAQREAEKHAASVAEREAGRRVALGNPPLVLGARDKGKTSKGVF